MVWSRTWKNKTGKLVIEGLGESCVNKPLRIGMKYDAMSYGNSL